MGLEQSVWKRRLLQAAVVFVGGTAGTFIRAVISQLWATAGWPWATFTINVTGSFALGFLLTGLQRLGPDTGWRQMARLGVGTGLLGGYTTYSTFIIETDSLASSGDFALAGAYCAASVVVGVALALLGTRAARGLRPRHSHAISRDPARGATPSAPEPQMPVPRPLTSDTAAPPTDPTSSPAHTEGSAS